MADKDTKKTSTEEKETQVGPRRPLLRSREDRVLWGVAGGLAEHIGFRPALVRAAFVITSLFGGAGLLAYLVLAVALPEDDGTGKPVPESVWARLGKVVLICVLVAVGLGLAAFLAAASAWTAATGHGTVVAGIVIGLGALMVLAAFVGDGRRRIVPWLLAAALVLGIPAGAIAAADIHIDESIGERTYTPTTVRDIPADGYELGTGQLTVDLRRLPWTKGQTIPVHSELGFGQLIVSVPTDVCVVGHAHAKAGELIVAGDVSHGVDPEIDQGTPTSQAPRVAIDAQIQFGQVIVTDEPPDQVDTHGADYDHHQQEIDTQERVCGR